MYSQNVCYLPSEKSVGKWGEKEVKNPYSKFNFMGNCMGKNKQGSLKYPKIPIFIDL